MTHELEDIKKMRKNLGITQKELAARSGVSQSLIAKIESGNIDPTYTKAKRILSTLGELEKKVDIKAEQIMTKRIVSIDESCHINEAIAKMKKFQISQLPVTDSNNPDNIVGLVSESSILDAIIGSKGKEVRDIMHDSPPTVSRKASVQVVSNLLKHYPMVLVLEKGKLDGMITKSDLIGKLYGEK